MKNKLVFEGTVDKWHVYKNADGFMEGYMSVGVGKGLSSQTNKDVRRVVSNQTTLSGFEKYVNGLRKKSSLKDKPLTPSELPSLFQ